MAHLPVSFRFVLLVSLLLPAPGCVPAQAITQAVTQRDVNGAHSGDAALPVEAVAIAEDAEDAWAAQLFLLDGTRLAPHVEARMAARGDLPEGY